MSKTDKKRAKIQSQLDELEKRFKDSLSKKANGAPEISLADYQKKVAQLQQQLAAL